MNHSPAAKASRYRIVHRTDYKYPQAVAVCQNEVRMSPRTFGHVTCLQNKIATSPHPTWAGSHVDYFGNSVVSFSVESMHDKLTVTSESLVSVDRPSYLRVVDDASLDVDWNVVIGNSKTWVDDQVDEFVYPSPRIIFNEAMRNYALQSFTQGRGIVDASLDLTCRINKEFKYDPNATTVSTPVGEAFRLRRGVCQDFAHVQIAMLRSIGLAASYISGYLRTLPPEGKPRLVGADESHAWLSVYGGRSIGWFDCDPTNATLAGTDHIPIAIGRDYADVTPMRGVVIGGGSPEMKVSVDVALQDEAGSVDATD